MAEQQTAPLWVAGSSWGRGKTDREQETSSCQSGARCADEPRVPRAPWWPRKANLAYQGHEDWGSQNNTSSNLNR